MNKSSSFVKERRKFLSLTKSELALKSGVGLRLSEIWNRVNKRLD